MPKKTETKQEPTKKTREEWLMEARDELSKTFFTKPSRRLPPTAVSCGIPAGSPKAIGQCWAADLSDEKVTEIFVCPSQDDPMMVIGILLHELVHAAVGVDAQHGKDFVRVARAVGLEGPAKHCLPDEACKKRLEPILERLGAYPHKKLKKTKEKVKKPQKKRVKLIDPQNEAYVISMEKEILDEFGPPVGPSGFALETKDTKEDA